MTSQKLTMVIGARTVQRAMAEPGELVIRFDDQSIMQVKTAGIADILPPRGINPLIRSQCFQKSCPTKVDAEVMSIKARLARWLSRN